MSAKLELECYSFAETPEEKPDWIWPGWLCRKSTSILGGKQGLGRGLMLCDLIARLSNGLPMPDGHCPKEAIKTLIITREDDPAMTLNPRLSAAGANMENVFWSKGYLLPDLEEGEGESQKTRIDDLREGAAFLDKLCRGKGISLVVIDPIGTWFTDSSNNAVIYLMNELAQELRICVLFVAHLKKGKSIEEMDDFAWPHQMTAAFRTAIKLEQIGQSEDRMLTVVKSNFLKPERGLVWHIDKHSSDPKLVWRGLEGEDILKMNNTKTGREGQ